MPRSFNLPRPEPPSSRPSPRFGAEGLDVVEATTGGTHVAPGAGDLACGGLVERYLERSDACDKRAPAIDAVQTVNPGASTPAARPASALVESGPAAPRGPGSSGPRAAPPRAAGPKEGPPADADPRYGAPIWAVPSSIRGATPSGSTRTTT